MHSFSVGLGLLAILLLVSGVDDLIPLGICLESFRRARFNKGAPVVEGAPGEERLLAIFVPSWRESAVIGHMVRHNLAVIRHSSFDFFLGVYPNDEPTVRAAQRLAGEFSNVHVAECPHAGPTSKADCLNWIYHRMEALEQERGVRFDTVILHDAEDLIHPQALTLIDRERQHYEMVQVPVLPLKTGFSEITHGVYCDEFAEYQAIDMRARQLSGSFVPSNGVGTGFAREVLQRLARERNNQVFDPGSLTEDYEIGVYIHAMGYRQLFSPLQRTEQGFIATREYFPRSMRAAVRQRTRWITGISLQCWERHGWRGSWRTRYWFWRDRKGLITNPLSVLANLVFIAGVLDYLLSLAMHRPWLFTVESRLVATLCAITLGIQCLRLTLRAICVGWIFGLTAALTVPLRAFHANLINCSAAVCAMHGYFRARHERRTLAWQKTDHAYPNRELLHAERRELADVLVGCGYVSRDQIEAARAQVESETALDLLMLASGLVSEEQMCRAMCVQSGLAAARVNLSQVNVSIARGLPAHIEDQYRVVPFAVRSGTLLVATPTVPSSEITGKVREAAELPVEFQLVTASEYLKLRELVARG